MSGFSADELAKRAATLKALHERRAAAEIADAQRLAPGSDRVECSGDLLPNIALVKGFPGPAEASGGAALSGADGEAIAKALEALGHDPAQVFAVLSRPEPGIDAEQRHARLRALLEAVDAPLVIGLDAEAAEDIAGAFGLARLAFGREQVIAGRRLVAVDGFEASLGDLARKKRVWAQLKAATTAPPAY